MKTCTYCKEQIQNWQYKTKSIDGLPYHEICYKQELRNIKVLIS